MIQNEARKGDFIESRAGLMLNQGLFPPSQSSFSDIDWNGVSLIVPEYAASGQFVSFACDNNYDYKTTSNNLSEGFSFTVDAITREFASTLTGRVDRVYGDLFGATTAIHEGSVNIRIVGDTSLMAYSSFTVGLIKKSDNLEGFSNWEFTARKELVTISTMRLEESTINPNKSNPSERADLSLLACVFCFKTAGMTVEPLSKDGGILDSLHTFNHVRW